MYSKMYLGRGVVEDFNCKPTPPLKNSKLYSSHSKVPSQKIDLGTHPPLPWQTEFLHPCIHVIYLFTELHVVVLYSSFDISVSVKTLNHGPKLDMPTLY